MALQQILFTETIAGMKKAFKRKAYESDSDSEVECLTNRGHKLQKRARFARQGQLAPTSGPSSYKQVIDHAGVLRRILYSNPPLVDDEGYEITSDDDQGRLESAELAAAELNPYANIRLEHILAPLTASTDLPSHPTLSKPFTSKTLSELIDQSCKIMRKENQSLWQVRHLWTALCGDGVWMPCETMVRSNDIALFTEDHAARFLQSLAKNDGTAAASPPLGMTNGDAAATIPKASGNGPQKQPDNNSAYADVAMAEATDPNDDTAAKGGDEADRPDGDGGQAAAGQNAETQGIYQTESGNGSTENAGEHAQGMGLMSASSGSQVPSYIHPIFLPPAGSIPERNMGLPENEAEDIRRLLALYVQKQEEVCRGASRLHEGLLRAERLRSDVLHWAKAEAHSGPNRDMSDGEDWYDKEEWGLTEDLKKGQDEEEEDTTTTGKKTRNRRTN